MNDRKLETRGPGPRQAQTPDGGLLVPSEGSNHPSRHENATAAATGAETAELPPSIDPTDREMAIRGRFAYHCFKEIQP